MKYKVDVIIPNYGETILLKRAVLSALTQLNIESMIWIADNGHSEEVTKYIRNEIEILSNRIKVLHLENPRHPGYARQQLLKSSRSPWIAFLDADDWWEETHLNTAINIMIQSKMDLISSDAYVHVSGKENPEKNTYFKGKERVKSWSFLLSNPNVNSSIVVRRLLVEELGDYPSCSSVRGVEDYAFTYEPARLGSMREYQLRVYITACPVLA